MLGRECSLKTHVRNLEYPIPLQMGGTKNHLFRPLHNLTAILTAYIFEMKQDINDRASALQTTSGLLHCLKPLKLWSINGFKLEASFHQPSVNSAFHFIAVHCRRRSANGTQPKFAKRWMVIRANEKLESSLLKKWGQITFTFVRFFDDFET